MKKPLILRNRDIFLVWFGQVLSQVGTRMYQIALVWWVLTEAGGSGREVGLFMVMGALPALLLVGVIGRAVDRWPTRALLVGCDLASFAAVGAVAAAMALDSVSLYGVYAVGFLVAALEALFNPAISKAVPLLAAPEDLEEAVAFQSSTQSLASFGGAVAGALLIDRIGILGVVVLNAVSFLVSALCNAYLSRAMAPSGEAAAQEQAQSSGWDVVSGTPWLKKVLLGFGCVNFFMTPILVILPLYVRQALSGGASLLGALEAALWLGLLAGTFLSRRVVFTPNTALIGAGCLAISGVCFFLPGLVVDKALFGILLFIAGTSLGINNVKFVSLFQELVAPQVKGRFFALMQALLSFTFPVAFLLFGVLADQMIVSRVCLIQGAGILVLAAYFLRLAYSETMPTRAA